MSQPVFPTAAALSCLPILQRLIGFDTTSRLSNLALIAWAKAYLEARGATCRLTYDDGGGKANLFATLAPTDPVARARPGVILSGHTDVVPVDGQHWSGDPFQLVERNGKLYGRGTTDMKGFLACALAWADRFQEAAQAGRLNAPVHYALSYDEEVGCLGARRMIDALLAEGVAASLCVVGEPTDMQVVIAHKGKMGVRARVRGLACHSALAHEGVNAVEAAAEAIMFLKTMARRHAAEGPFDPDYAPPYTTVHCGVIQGGQALNIVPEDCWFDFEFRWLPGQDPEAMLASVRRYCQETLEPPMKALSPDAGFSFEVISCIPGLHTDENDPAVTYAKGLAEANAVAKVSYGTEAGLFQTAGAPTVVCGPGSIEQAHKPDEFVEVAQLARCEAFLARLTARLTTSPAG